MPINFTEIINGTGLINWSMQGYVGIFGFFTYPLIFCGIIGYIYMKQQSVIAAAVATLILFSVFNFAAGAAMFVTIMQIFVTLAIGALFYMFFTRWRKG